ncbi:hypothetical protein VAEU17_4420017 [Vibrio aestuarianus]|nr:hypothetical protein VAEU17_4420017 [Vibrio aestuarianus]
MFLLLFIITSAIFSLGKPNENQSLIYFIDNKHLEFIYIYLGLSDTFYSY